MTLDILYDAYGLSQRAQRIAEAYELFLKIPALQVSIHSMELKTIITKLISHRGHREALRRT